MNDSKRLEYQTHIINQMKVLPEISAPLEARKRIGFLKDYLKSSGRKGFVLGISGGQDSALVGKLAQMAVEELRNETGSSEYQFLALLLPYGVQKDFSDAVEAAHDFIKADGTQTFQIQPTVDAFAQTFNENSFELVQDELSDPEVLRDYHKGNVKARVRMLTQYAYAGQRDLLVLGSDHSSENVTGFATVGGDLQADLVPIFGLNKRQGKELLRYLGSPEKFYMKAPTADLLDNAPQQTDETELGISYDEIDDYLEGKLISADSQDKILSRFLKTDFKRHLPVTIY